MPGEKAKTNHLPPLILVLGYLHPLLLPFFQHGLLDKFRLLKPSDFPTITLSQFLTTHAQSVRALLCFDPPPIINAEILNYLPSLECVVATHVGVNHIDVVDCKRRGIVIANAGTVCSEDVADCAVGLLLDVLKGISASDRYVRSELWLKGKFPLCQKDPNPIHLQVGGKRVGIVGLGSIGLEVAKRLEAFNCNIAYNSRTKKPSVTYHYYSNVRDLAANSDILILCCALTGETHHMINKDVLLALGETGVVINVGRGALIDEKELVRSLLQGDIRGAGLDVFEDEPNVPEELFKMDNIVLSPHNAVMTPESLVALKELAAANLEAFFSNKPLLSQVNF